MLGERPRAVPESTEPEEGRTKNNPRRVGDLGELPTPTTRPTPPENEPPVYNAKNQRFVGVHKSHELKYTAPTGTGGEHPKPVVR